MKYSRVFVAGTFDRLHKGHRFFLISAFSVGKSVTIGLTSDDFTDKFKAQSSHVKSFTDRKHDLVEWLNRQKYTKRSTIVAINDPYEPASSFPESAVLLVTTDNKKRGEEINDIRKKRRLPPLTLIEIPLIKAEDNLPISSTRVRNGEIDKEGKLILPDNLRPQLQQPLGLVLHGKMIEESLAKHRGKTLITVGDVATKTLLNKGITPSLIIIDNKVERKPYKELAKWRKTALATTHKVQSGPGYIARGAVELIRRWKKFPKKSFVLEVDGEEDLLTLPVITEAPIGSIVYYGQPPVAAWACGPVVEGMVEIDVTKKRKREATKLLDQFLS